MNFYEEVLSSLKLIEQDVPNKFHNFISFHSISLTNKTIELNMTEITHLEHDLEEKEKHAETLRGPLIDIENFDQAPIQEEFM